MLKDYKDEVLVIKHYALDVRRKGGFIKVYVTKAKDLNDYNRGLVDDNGRVDVNQMVDITEQLIPLIGTRIDSKGRIWYPGIGSNRIEVIVKEIQQKTNNLFDNRAIVVYRKGNHIYER